MSVTFNQLSAPIVEPPQVVRPLRPNPPHPEKVPVEDAIFSSRELERFREEDAEAGRTICAIMSTLFTISVILALVVLTWTLSRGV